MSATAQPPNRKAIASMPSARLLEIAEANPTDCDLLEFIQGELDRRDVAVAASASRRIGQMLTRLRMSGEPSPEFVDGERESKIAALQARLEAMERRVREAEARASAAERALATEALPSRGNGLLRRVHLAETAPVWLVEAARRAFRLRFHPDRFADPVMKARAEETFKEAEEVFRQIATAQGSHN